MKALHISLLLLTALALMTGGCTPQPPAKAQAVIDAQFVLKTTMKDGRMVFAGVGGEIDGAINPDLIVQEGDTVHIILINDDGMPHDLAIPDLNLHTSMITSKDQETDATFQAGEAGDYAYFCTVPGHRQAGMEGKLVVEPPQE